jgi:hypothetical protein
MKKKLILKNKTQSLYRIYSYEDAKKHFPNAHFSSSKRTWRLFLDIEALSENLLEDFTKHLLLFKDGDNEYYIVVNIGDQVDETNIKDQKLMKSATILMKNYSVSDKFIEFIKENDKISESERISYVKDFVPEIYLDYVIDNKLEIDQWTWLPRNLIKKQLLSNPKYLSYLIKKDSESQSDKNESSAFIVNYLLSGAITKKTLNFLKELFNDQEVLNKFQETIDKITTGDNYCTGRSLTKSILKNIFVLEKESVIKINLFNTAFVSLLEYNFPEEHLEYLDFLINKKVRYYIEEGDDGNYSIYSSFDSTIMNFFYKDDSNKRFEYLISYVKNLEDIIQKWREMNSYSLFEYCFKPLTSNSDKNEDFKINNLTELLEDPIRSKFIFLEDFIKNDEEKQSDYSIRNVCEVFAKTNLKLLYNKCVDDEFFKNNIIKYYTAILDIWDGEKYNNENFLERIQNVYNLDKKNVDFINLNYFFNEDYNDLNKTFNFDYNSSNIQLFFEKKYLKYIDKEIESYYQDEALRKIQMKAENKNFIKQFNPSKWNNKELVKIFNPIVDFDTDFDLSELEKLLTDNNVNGVNEYCLNNKDKIRNTFKRDGNSDFVKNIRKIAQTLMG